MNVWIPQNLLIGSQLPACLARTWLQLRCLAGESGRTPPCSPQGLRRLTGKSVATLYRHLGRLKAAGLLDWRCLPEGLQVSFEAGADPTPAEPAESVADQNCASLPAPADRPADPTQESRRQPKAGIPDVPTPGGFSILGADSQICIAASLNTLTDYLINLTRGEAHNSKSRIQSKLRIRSQNPPPPASQATNAPPPADDPLVIYRRLARLTPNPAQRDLLLQRVHDLPRWRETLEHWLAHRWNPRNLPGMLDLYQRGGASGCRYCPKPVVSKASDAFQQLRAQYAAEKPAPLIPASDLEGPQ